MDAPQPQPQPSPPPVEDIWRSILLGTDARYRRTRALLRHVPSGPRCKMCAAPFHGLGARVMRLVGHAPWDKNSKYCRTCFGLLTDLHGGAEIECTLLFADVRGSTPMAEELGPRAFRGLMDRFFGTAAALLIDHEAIVDRFIGDEVFAIFIPAVAGEAHAARAIEAARALLVATGHGLAEGPWLPIGAGVNTGTAFVGAVGEGAHTELTALGDPVNVAARLASAALAGEVLATMDAVRLAGIPLDGLERRSLDLKGKTAATEVVVFRAGGVPAIASTDR